ncbi:phosphopantetheine-binding protein [Qingshengfaniella alkalisoli]|uniref:Phosphopantetheine-binding protein n=1 Tax=Qingshengfaniella alkalisoli TaxID=2599296 RepID=A0A5B8IXZ9_9RHOB|nr:phosphopantetheine-binding protein [Qingshengfaniella alkalisoli]QDY71032.1 phosphopantetheine-binding protein [Qingshengfaniella alkalisoli]
MTQNLTKTQIRADLANALKISPSELADDDSLLDFGLDSMRALGLLMKWEEAVPGLDYSRFMETETLAEWWGIIDATQSRS